MSGYRKLGRATDVRVAMLRNLTTNLLYHGRIQTTETRAKEVRRIAEKLITVAVKERDNVETVTVVAKTPRKDAKGARVKEVINGKRRTVFDETQKEIKKDSPSRLNARRKILSVLYPVTEVGRDEKGRRKRALTKSVDMAKLMFDDIAPKYADRKGGYTRIVKLGPRKGDGAEQVFIELI